MAAMTSKERIPRIIRRQSVDRIGLGEGFWGDTIARWRKEGHLGESEDPERHFGIDTRDAGWVIPTANLDWKDQILEETDEHKLVLDGNGAKLRWWKGRSGTPEHVDFTVKDRRSWEEHARPFLTDASTFRRRSNVDWCKSTRTSCDADGICYKCISINVFECMHPVCGHEHMLMGMIADPDWVHDMCNVYADLIANCLEIMFAEGGAPDIMWFFEDMGFKERPFMSPAMYKEFIQPAHVKTFAVAKRHNVPIVVHSCGFVEPLVPGLIEAGMDCLQAIETKAGMDLVRLKKAYGDRISFCGGMDVRTLETNDLALVQAELDAKLPIAMASGGYILHSDHSIPQSVDYKTYRFFRDRGLEMGTY